MGQLNMENVFSEQASPAGRRGLLQTYRTRKCSRIEELGGCDNDEFCFDCVEFFGVPHWVEYRITYTRFRPRGCDDNNNIFKV